jgi:hypothetical protein
VAFFVRFLNHVGTISAAVAVVVAFAVVLKEHGFSRALSKLMQIQGTLAYAKERGKCPAIANIFILRNCAQNPHPFHSSIMRRKSRKR